MSTMELKEVIPFEYSHVHSFSEGLALVCNDDKWGFIDKTGTLIISCEKYNVPTDNHYPFSLFGTGFREGLAAVSAKVDDSRKYGFIDKSGNEVIPLKYDIVRDFSCGIAIVGIADKNLKTDSYGALGCKWGAINKNGDEIIPIGKYKSVGCYGWRDYCRDNPGVSGTTSDRMDRKYYEEMTSVFVCSNNNDSPKYGFADILGNEVVPPIYTGVNRFHNGLSSIEVIDHKKTGPVITKAAVIDKTGEIVIPFKYQRIDSFYDEITVAHNWNPYETFFVSKKGNQPFPLKYHGAYAFHEGMAEVYSGTDSKYKHGFIDINGQEIVPCKYDNVGSYYDSIAIVGMGDYWYGMKGAVDKQGREFIPCKYNHVKQLRHGFVAACIERRKKRNNLNCLVESKWGIFDKFSNEIVPLIYDNVYWFCEGMAAVKKKGKWGFIEKSYGGKEYVVQESSLLSGTDNDDC